MGTQVVQFAADKVCPRTLGSTLTFVHKYGRFQSLNELQCYVYRLQRGPRRSAELLTATDCPTLHRKDGHTAEERNTENQLSVENGRGK